MGRPAFTLIETLVYLALFGILIGGFVTAAYGMFESAARNQTKAMLQEEKDFVTAKINWALSDAKLVTVPAAGAAGATLTVTPYVGPSRTLAASGSGVTLDGAMLTNSNVTISKLVFIHTYAAGTNPDSVEAGFTISALTPTGGSVTQTATTTRYLHK